MSRTIVLKLSGRPVGESLYRIADFDLSHAIKAVLADSRADCLEAMRQKLLNWTAEVKDAQARLRYPHLFDESRKRKQLEG